MKEINLKHIYPHLSGDYILLVDDAIAEIFEESRKREQAYQRKAYRHKAFYSLNRDDCIESAMLQSQLTPGEIFERQEQQKTLYQALRFLPVLQARRIYAHFILDISKSDIAKSEGVSVRAVCTAIDKGLERLRLLINY